MKRKYIIINGIFFLIVFVIILNIVMGIYSVYANPYPSPRDYGLINSYNIIPVLFSILMILIILKQYVSWYSKRTKYIGNRKPNGWKCEVPFYRVHCEIHGFYETSKQGWEKELRCPICISERDEYNES